MRSFRQNNVTHTDDDFLTSQVCLVSYGKCEDSSLLGYRELRHFCHSLILLPLASFKILSFSIATLAKYGQSYKNYVHLFSVSSSNNTPRIRESQSNE
ncbi:unnamed protein product [Rhizophagus irregularis]|nr:unnamed protein product [Rhizophagus irregularis]CAB4419535.1 unnamed protein product [Rhizophagus irregularis]